jgi:hypothetical protein
MSERHLPFLGSWNRYWFAPESPANLGLCRCLFFSALCVCYWNQDFSAWGDVSLAFWFPMTLFTRLRLLPFTVPALSLMTEVWKVSLAFAAVGLATRVATPVAFLLGTYLLGLPHNFGKMHHFDAMLVLVLGILAVSRCGAAWSVDRVIAQARGKSEPEPSGEYRWPVRAVWLVLSLVFFGAGVSKLRHGGIAWVRSDNMSITLVQHAYQIANENPATSWGLWVARVPYLSKLMALGTIIIETGYPLSLFSRRARWFFPPAMCGALVGIRLLMGPTFSQLVICHLFWVPWDRVACWFVRVGRRNSADAGNPGT